MFVSRGDRSVGSGFYANSDGRYLKRRETRIDFSGLDVRLESMIDLIIAAG